MVSERIFLPIVDSNISEVSKDKNLGVPMNIGTRMSEETVSRPSLYKGFH
jgi:hypothetical protein